jgi:hypothetical protein
LVDGRQVLRDQVIDGTEADAAVSLLEIVEEYGVLSRGPSDFIRRSFVMAIRSTALGLLFTYALLVTYLAGSSSFANDSAAELSVGGLIFSRTADVSLESEELTITPDLVVVRYQFLNQTPKAVTLTVAFSLPDIDLSEGENYVIPANDPTNFLAFETKVNGKPITFTIRQTAHLGSKDISAALRNAGVPLLPIGPEQPHLAELPESTRNSLIDQGLLLQNGTDDGGRQLYIGAWTVKTAAVRQQTFPPNSPVAVEHRYRTSVGVSFDTILRKELRQNSGMAKEVQRYRSDYCITDAFLARLDTLSGSAAANTAHLQERRISYILKTGANWAGPIKDFRLVVDKQQRDRLISFCGNNIKQISPSAFEVRAKDFTPDKDLRILIVGRF